MSPNERGERATTRCSNRLIDIYLVGWSVGASIASAGLLLRGQGLAARSQWPASSWQREIGLWNLILITLVVQALASGHRGTKLALARTGVAASLLLGGNHLLTLMAADAGSTRLHRLALAANALNLVTASAVLAVEGRRERSGRLGSAGVQRSAPRMARGTAEHRRGTPSRAEIRFSDAPPPLPLLPEDASGSRMTPGCAQSATLLEPSESRSER